MSVDGQAEWIENKADQIFQELINEKVNKQGSKQADLWEQAYEQAAIEYQNTDCNYDYDEEEEN